MREKTTSGEGSERRKAKTQKAKAETCYALENI